MTNLHGKKDQVLSLELGEDSHKVRLEEASRVGLHELSTGLDSSRLSSLATIKQSFPISLTLPISTGSSSKPNQ